MKVLLLRTWITNIGNGFIDMGAKQILENTFPDATITETSGYPNLAADRQSLGELSGVGKVFRSLTGTDKLYELRKFIKSKASDDDILSSSTNIADLMDVDLAVLPGCILYEHALRPYLPTLKKLRDRGVPIVLLGAGGGDYSPETQSYVRNALRQVDPDVLITRDSVAYECYGELVEESYDGIDCAFFIDEWYTPPEANTDFSALTFDKLEEPNLGLKNRIIRPNHRPFGEAMPLEGAIKLLWASQQQDDFSKQGVFVSDNLKDYLFIYANADVTHSDRIHACVPALAYGNEAQFYYRTPRGKLFERAFDEDIYAGPVSLDQSRIEQEKADQVAFLREAVNSVR